MSSDFFRANVGACIVCDGRVLLFQRVHSSRIIWQMPQGGLLLGESPEEGVYREVFEETGLYCNDLSLIEALPFWLGYELPSRLMNHLHYGRGQVQKWFLFSIQEKSLEHICFSATPQKAEFVAYQLIHVKDVYAHMPDFKLSVITEMLAWFITRHPHIFNKPTS